MTTKSGTTFSEPVNEVSLPERTNFSADNIMYNHRFDTLFAAVFDGMKMQDVVGNAALSDLLNTIANISNNLGR